MALETLIIPILAKASGKMLDKVIDRWWPSKESTAKSVDKDAVAVLAKEDVYRALRGGLTDNCVRILKLLEDGENRRVAQIREYLHPNLKVGAKNIQVFDAEFRYRLEYMLTIGLLARAGSEFAISRLGQAFIQRARSQKDYNKVLFP
jgi:hypothetical protein